MLSTKRGAIVSIFSSLTILSLANFFALADIVMRYVYRHICFSLKILLNYQNMSQNQASSPIFQTFCQ